MSRGKRLIRLLVAALASAFTLLLIFRLASPGSAIAPQAALFEVLRRTLPGLLAGYVFCQIAQTAVRAIRYGLLLRAGLGTPPPFFDMFLITAARNMLVDLLPARAGELGYVALLNSCCAVPGALCLSSLSVSIFFDLLALCVLLPAVLFFPLAAKIGAMTLIPVLGLTFVALFVAWQVLFRGAHLAAGFLQRVAGRRRQLTLLLPLARFLAAFAEALRNTRGAGVLGRVLLLSFAVRVLKYAGLYFIFLAVTLPSFPLLAQMHFAYVVAAFVAAEAMASLPVPALMSFGVYEGGGMLVFMHFGFSAADSALAVLAMHIFSQSMDYALGGASLSLLSLAGGSAQKKRARWWLKSGGLVSALVLAVCVTVPVLAFIYFRSGGAAGPVQPPAAGSQMAIDERVEKLLAQEMGEDRGFVVWSSNRSGQHDIYMLSLPQRRLERLTTHAHSEYFPRIAPDGSAILFCRSRRPWLSQRNDALWDTYLLDLASRQEKRLAEYANVPTWSEDGKTVYFQRNSIQMVARDLETGRETVLWQSGLRGIPVGVGLQGPDVRESDATLAVTFRGGRGPRIIALCPAAGGYREVGGGSLCQLAWSRDERFLYAVGRGGRMKNAIYRIDPLSADATIWLDLAGEYGHEYFPRQSNDGRYLVCGASAGGHEHDTADYEIFLWKIGSAPQAAMRLTHHSGNDCWPDVFIYPAAAVQSQ